jgi:hypothetical protein
MASRPKILCISLTPITGDARVLRQIEVLGQFGDVTTVGFGTKPEGSAEHIEVPASLKTLPQTVGGVAALALRLLARSELSAPAVRFALEALRGRTFDLVVSNDARVLALAHEIASGVPVWADLHEWAPEERSHILSWRLLVAPLMVYLCAKYLPRSAAVTTVCDSIARLYGERFGVETQVMRNSGPWRDLSPTPVSDDTIRLVHSGAAVHGRSIETMIDVVLSLNDDYTLDLYLVPGGDGGKYLDSLKKRASDCDRITFRAPVAPAAIPDTLNDYDVGVFWIPPTHTNARFALPNKFFDYVQARLAIAVGPSVEMASLVERHGLGAVSAGFEVEQCRESLLSLDREQIIQSKLAADAAARELSFETDERHAQGIIKSLLTARAVEH